MSCMYHPCLHGLRCSLPLLCQCHRYHSLIIYVCFVEHVSVSLTVSNRVRRGHGGVVWRVLSVLCWEGRSLRCPHVHTWTFVSIYRNLSVVELFSRLCFPCCCPSVPFRVCGVGLVLQQWNARSCVSKFAWREWSCSFRSAYSEMCLMSIVFFCSLFFCGRRPVLLRLHWCAHRIVTYMHFPLCLCFVCCRFPWYFSLFFPWIQHFEYYSLESARLAESHFVIHKWILLCLFLAHEQIHKLTAFWYLNI